MDCWMSLEMRVGRSISQCKSYIGKGNHALFAALQRHQDNLLPDLGRQLVQGKRLGRRVDMTADLKRDRGRRALDGVGDPES